MFKAKTDKGVVRGNYVICEEEKCFVVTQEAEKIPVDPDSVVRTKEAVVCED